MAWYSKVNDAPITGLSFSDSGLVAGENYFYKITAVNAVGQESGCCEPVFVKALEEAPMSVPDSVNTAVVNDDIMKISWSAVSGAAGYNIYVAVGEEKYQKLNKEVIEDTTCYHLGLQSNTYYRYKIQAWNKYGVSELSEVYGARTSSKNATGNSIGVIGKYPLTVTMEIDADVSASKDGTFTAGSSTNECVNSSKVSFLKLDLSKLPINSGDEVDSARLFIYRSGSTSPVAVHRVESDSTDYDNWGEALSDDGVTMDTFTQGNLCFGIVEDALTEVEGYAAKPSANKSYNSSDGEGINITKAVRDEITGDQILTLQISAIGTGGSNGMSFHSRHAGNDYVPHAVIMIRNYVIEEYEQQEHEQLPEEIHPGVPKNDNDVTSPSEGATSSDRADSTISSSVEISSERTESTNSDSEKKQLTISENANDVVEITSPSVPTTDSIVNSVTETGSEATKSTDNVEVITDTALSAVTEEKSAGESDNTVTKDKDTVIKDKNTTMDNVISEENVIGVESTTGGKNWYTVLIIIAVLVAGGIAAGVVVMRNMRKEE